MKHDHLNKLLYFIISQLDKLEKNSFNDKQWKEIATGIRGASRTLNQTVRHEINKLNLKKSKYGD
jgi:hypothetical protein